MKEIPEPSKKRLIILSQLLTQQTQKKITSPEISRLTGWSESTVRKDISLLELHNGVSNGYEVKNLCDSINQLLNLSTAIHNLCIVGLGNPGLGFLEKRLFENTGFNLAAAFDTNQNRLDMIKTEIPLFPTLDLEIKIRQLKIEYAILSVPDEKAQFMADRLVKYGIKGIINYTNTVLILPPQIKLINASPVYLLQLLQ